MADLEHRLELAKKDNGELDQLIKDYLPFLKKNLTMLPSIRLEYDDKLSLSMLTFMDCVRKYELGKGNFISFATHCIKNRLVDESKKQSTYAAKVIPLTEDKEFQGGQQTIDLNDEKKMLQEEIQNLGLILKDYQIAFRELPHICPKQKRSRNQCLGLAKILVSDESLKERFLRTRRLPQQQLATVFDLSLKTVEKHRKYIITLALMLLGDYPGIRSFLPQYREVK